MQLQNGIEALSGAGAVVYALSYDEADALRDFREAHGITYRLLSDPDSRVIRSSASSIPSSPRMMCRGSAFRSPGRT